MGQYRIFNEADALVYASDQLDFFPADADLTATEFGDGNLNLVFKVTDQNSKQSVILKQALPYARCVGESWPLSTDRARIEAQVLQIHGEICPEHTVKILKFDEPLSLMAMEDLSDHQIWRAALIDGKQHPNTGKHIARYLAKTLFYTSDFYLDPKVKKAKVAQFINPDLCLITEDLFFTDPYREHERNSFNALIEKDVLALREDFALQSKVAALKYKFLNHAEALLHGDVHSGSIFVTATSTKVIDAEFGYYGPIGFDVGSPIGNLLLNYAGQIGLNDLPTAKAFQAYLCTQISQLWQTFETEFTRLLNEETTDVAFKLDEFQHKMIQQIFIDAIGFAGTELIRRTIGLAHVADIMNIEDTAVRAKSERLALALGRALVMQAEQFETIDDVLDCVNLVSKKFL
ncbi:S-methyl-5-thioribose kinase [Catenovulum sp. 2E275]|uniref:S-methyl-5-thioribose kinase n=1 Tax=Catenovulum sp. 2E275 TaxID=2980497 RepID=UPI0021CE67C1|nr:S-methyl-5-thioribose kinase [Catenovulum sp. 2E275]MCU4675190.1 S-methyl-5-thioribose kinase [Catenovulum sp. 2E275]